MQPASCVGLEAVIATAELDHRAARPADYAAENRAMAELAQAFAGPPDQILTALAEAALQLCHARSAGFSLLDTEAKRFYWPAIVGEWARHQGQGTLREFGPCGTVLDRNAPQLMRRPERHFQYLTGVQPYMEEVLLIPFYVHGKAVGTIWVMSHDTHRHFDAEDLRTMTRLSKFAAAAYQALYDSKQRWVSLLEALPVPVYTTDEQGVITAYNRAAAELAGREPAVGVDQWCVSWKLYWPDGRSVPHDQSPMATAVKEDRAVRDVEIIVERPDGTRIDCMPLPTPLHDSAGALIGAINLLVDVTERKKSEIALRTTEKLAIVGRLAASLAHEINNPLEAVTNIVYLARENPGTPERIRKLLQSADEELDRVRTITQQTLGSCRESVTREPVRLSALLQGLLALYSPRLKARQIRTTLQIGQEGTVTGFPGELRQVFSNLLSNSIDAVANGGRIELCVRSRGEDDTVEVLIRDDGPGILDALQSRIFDPFFTTKKELGTGLGLWIAKQILGDHDGSLHLRNLSRSGQHGTEVTVVLPAARGAAA